eukprot:4502178-Heterocapsa_arctica.AAC.1
MPGCMNEHKRLEERPHRQGHSSEVALNKPGMNKLMIGGHNGIFHNIGVQNKREDSDTNNTKEADWPTCGTFVILGFLLGTA